MSVRLRRLRAEDGPRVLAWRNSEAVAPYMYGDHRITAEEHALWLAGALQAADRRYWIVELDSAPVGLADVVRIDRANLRAEWAYYLADPAVRGRGVGAAVEYSVLEQVFGPFGLHKLWCEVLADNEAVWKLHESFGFRREALLRDHVLKGGRWRDVVGLSLLADEWSALREGCAARLRDKGQDPSALTIED